MNYRNNPMVAAMATTAAAMMATTANGTCRVIDDTPYRIEPYSMPPIHYYHDDAVSIRPNPIFTPRISQKKRRIQARRRQSFPVR